ncbi:hypothetical protein H2136_15340 [Aeromonas hydrophila]|uniref:Uncharacterized protein n=1 Tax=Aeromonas hydrophila TaxID=644 RepID=A0A926FKD6_AERHY|nr:hypothetical protein [Aeromonas hydrophila]
MSHANPSNRTGSSRSCAVTSSGSCLPLTLIEDPMSQLNRLMQWDMQQIDDREYRRRL